MNNREKQETALQSDWVLNYIEGHTVDCSHGKSHHNFTFDSVFDPDSSQVSFYSSSYYLPMFLYMHHHSAHS